MKQSEVLNILADKVLEKARLNAMAIRSQKVNVIYENFGDFEGSTNYRDTFIKTLESEEYFAFLLKAQVLNIIHNVLDYRPKPDAPIIAGFGKYT